MSEQPDKNQHSLGCLLAAVAVVAFIAWVGGSSDSTQSMNVPASTNEIALPEEAAALSAAVPAKPSPLDASSAQRGYAQFRRLAGLGADGSAQIYSRNCYDAIGKNFDWHQLDRCGGFDALAARWTDESDSADGDALTYFQSETAATRYLQAALANGLAAPEADQRWARLQALARKTRLDIEQKPSAEPLEENTADDAPLVEPTDADAENLTVE